ncbi:MAG: HAD-IC family P-type ATPase [Patescibacteria group bacterium]
MANHVPKTIPWHHHSVKDVLTELETSKNGLKPSAAEERKKEFGPNQLPSQPPRPVLEILFSQFLGPLMIILIVAAAISGFLLEWLDVTVIMAAVLMNGILGFFEEYKADRSLQALKKYLPQEVKIRRNGQIYIIQAADVVPGDIMLLSMGDKITADGRIISSQHFETNESALTGESLPIKKQTEVIELGALASDQKNMVFAGTVAVHGRAEVIVTGTALETEIGRITKLVIDVKDEDTPLQRQLKVLARILGIWILVIAVGVYIFGIFRGHEAVEMFKVAVAIAVSAVPEGLVVGVTVILAIGMQRILKRQALVRRLIAAETLGSVSVICADKTGTLTTGIMSVDEVRLNGRKIDANADNDQSLDLLRRVVLLANAADFEIDPKTGEQKIIGSPTETALARYTQSYSGPLRFDDDRLLSEIPFDSEIKFAARLYDTRNGIMIFAIGAPDVLIEHTDLSEKKRQDLEHVYQDMTKDGLRVLMVAQAKQEKRPSDFSLQDVKDLEVLGFIGLRDPLRQEAAAAIKEAREAGMIPVMITGDHPETARVIAQKAGLNIENNGIVTGAELDDMDDETLLAKVDSIYVYARVMPGHKLRIIKAWQRRGQTVAMTGDGVNDAPALKAADIGIALGSGTEVAKETAEIVLLDNNFKTIVSAVREGRIIFDNIRKLVVYLLSDSFSEIILVVGALLFSFPLPILPAQILWINLITDGFPSVALTFEPGEKGVMKDKPRKEGERIINTEMKVLIFIVAIFTDLLLFTIFFYLLGRGVSIEEVRTFVFVALGVDSLFYVFAIRKFRSSVFRSNPFENKFLIGGVLLGFALQFAPLVIVPLRELFQFTTLTPLEWVVIIALAFVQLLLIEVVKEFYNYHRFKDGKTLSVEAKAV